MKVVIVGKGRGWDEAPPCGKGYEIWGVTQLNLRREVDLVIDMNDYSENRWGPAETLEATQSRNKAVHENVSYVDLMTYPYRKIVKKFGSDYFSSTVAFAVALAIHRGAAEIEMYGVTLEVPSEYAYQKPCVEYWCGYARGKGIKVTSLGEHTTLFKTKDGLIYGYGLKQGGGNGVNKRGEFYGEARPYSSVHVHLSSFPV